MHEEHPEPAEPGEEQGDEEARVGDGERRQVHCGRLTPQTGRPEHGQRRQVTHHPDEDDHRRDVPLHEGVHHVLDGGGLGEQGVVSRDHPGTAVPS